MIITCCVGFDKQRAVQRLAADCSIECARCPETSAFVGHVLHMCTTRREPGSAGGTLMFCASWKKPALWSFLAARHVSAVELGVCPCTYEGTRQGHRIHFSTWGSPPETLLEETPSLQAFSLKTTQRRGQKGSREREIERRKSVRISLRFLFSGRPVGRCVYGCGDLCLSPAGSCCENGPRQTIHT